MTWLSKTHEQLGVDVGLLIARLTLGGLMLTHGIPKLLNFSEKSGGFPDPLGVGSSMSLALAIFAEVGCAILLMAGAFTRIAASQLVITMGVAAFVVHRTHAFGKKELALVYLVGYLALFFTGGGRFSIDRLLFRSKESDMPAAE